MKTRILRTTSVLALLAAGVAACDSGGGGGGGTTGGGLVITPPPPVASPVEDGFGLGFGAIFRTGENTDPTDPPENALIPVTFTTDPVPIP
jgi:hypothetical protein